MSPPAAPDRRDGPTVVVVPVPEIRDYQRINTEVARQLDQGAVHLRLTGADGHRLLLHGLSGGWQAVVEIEGSVGPELAAELGAPGLTVVCRGSAADGAGRGLRAGSLVIQGNVGAAVGCAQSGGQIAVVGAAGPRAGLGMQGGTLLIRGAADRLAGERQQGGWIFLSEGRAGPHAGHARRGGRLVWVAGGVPLGDAEDLSVYQQLQDVLTPWLAADSGAL